MGTCGDPRYLIRLPVELSGSDGGGNRFKQTAYTHNVSLRGARITQAPSFLCPAEMVELRFRGRRSRFRVVWVGGLGGNEIGLRTLEPARCIWGHPLPGQLIRSAPPVPTVASSPRFTPRPASLAPVPGPPDLTERSTQPGGQPTGFFCKDPECHQRHVFHRLPGDRIVWDIWPQKFECPVSGRRHEYSKGDLRHAGYV